MGARYDLETSRAFLRQTAADLAATVKRLPEGCPVNEDRYQDYLEALDEVVEAYETFETYLDAYRDALERVPEEGKEEDPYIYGRDYDALKEAAS